MVFRLALLVALGGMLAASACAGGRTEPGTGPRQRLPPGGLAVSITAYCLGGLTKSGTPVRRGVVAADPAWLPLGSRIRIHGLGRHDGVYTVLDTGPAIKGPEIDLFMPSCTAANQFGRRAARIVVLRRGRN